MNFEILILLAPLVFAFPRHMKSVVAAVIISLGAIGAAIASIITLATSYSFPSFDGINSVFVLAIAIVGIASSIYAVGFTRDMLSEKKTTQISIHFLCLIILFYAMIGVVTSTSTYQFLLWWELMTLSSFILVIFEASRKEVLHAGISYLIVMHISFFFLLGGFSHTGTNMWAAPSLIVWIVMLVGFGIKSALFPLHIWLPVTYLNTPTHVTAMMSGVMINMGVYGIIRTSMASNDPYTIGLILFCVGALSGLFGIIKAATHTGIKRLLAYSSVENMGIITMAIGLGTIGRAIGSESLVFCGYGGALLHTINHSVYKSMLFMAAGAVEKATRRSDLNLMGGLLQKMPVTGWVFAIGALAISAIPPFSGFFSEFTIFMGLFSIISDGSQPIIGICGIIILALIGGLAMMTFSKVFTITFLGRPRTKFDKPIQEANNTMVAAYALPLLCVVAGGAIFPFVLFPGADEILGLMVQIMLGMGIAIGIIVALWFIRRALQRGRAVDTQATWGCAFTAPNKNMQYTSSSMSRELQESMSSETKQSQVELTEIFPSTQSFETKHTDRANRLITHASQRFLRLSTARLAIFQTGKTNHYVLHALIFLILIFLLSIMEAI